MVGVFALSVPFALVGGVQIGVVVAVGVTGGGPVLVVAGREAAEGLRLRVPFAAIIGHVSTVAPDPSLPASNPGTRLAGHAGPQP